MKAPVLRVAEVAEQVRGVTYAKEDASATPLPGYLPILRAGNITDEGLDFGDLIYVPAVRVSSKQRIRQHDIVIAASSGSLLVVGKAAQAPTDFDGGFGAFCKVVRPGSDVDARYLGHFFRTSTYRSHVQSLAAGVGINNLRNEHIDEIELPFPPLPTQRRIAAILDHADALRAKRRAALAEVEGLGQAIFEAMFGDPIQNPMGYPKRTMIELVDSDRPISYGILMPGPDQTHGVQYIRVVDMRNGGIELAGIRRTTQAISNAYRRSLLRGGDLLMSIRGHVGRLAVVPKELEGANITQDTARLAIVESNPVFVRECLRTPALQRWMVKHTKGVAVRGINLGDVKLLPIIQPPMLLQEDFARRMASVETLAAHFRASLSLMDALFTSLQHRAFRGEL